MSSTYKHRFYNQPKENDIKFNKVGQTRMLVICLDYEGTQNQLNCTIDGKRIIREAKKNGVVDIVAMFDNGSTDYFPTKKNVSSMMKEMAEKCQVGDMLVVYYSGHGTSITDRNKDQQDGKDQAFCLMSQDRQIQCLLDDDVSDLISKNLHPQVPCLFIVDACHSGSILDLTKDQLWGGKKIFSISGCQDSQTSNDTGNGGQMTNILLEVLDKARSLRQKNSASIQYIFNRMIVLNEQIQGKYSEGSSQPYKFSNTSTQLSIFDLLQMCFSGLSVCKDNKTTSNGGFMDLVQGFTNFDDQQGEFQKKVQKPKDGQWINLAWNGGSDPTKLPFPF